MFLKLFSKIKKSKVEPVKDEAVKEEEPKVKGFFSTDADQFNLYETPFEMFDALVNTLPQPEYDTPVVKADGSAMDSVGDGPLPLKLTAQNNSAMPEFQLAWYGSQSFIGFQACAILAQNWLIEKACSMPAEDSVRKGFKITVNDGQDIDPAILDDMREIDSKFNLDEKLIDFVTKGRIFGIRVAYFVVESEHKDYYEKPFNIDSVKPGSYKGIVQIDPYWIIGQLDLDGLADPSAMDYYEPTWWQVGIKKIHKSHCIIYRNGKLPDLLKPTYFWGSVSIPQKMAERAYAADRLANEAPLLALTKRTDIYKVDAQSAVANGISFYKKIQQWVYNRTNFGIKIIDKENEDVMQFDTSLTGLDENVMTQFQLCAAECGVPAVKLLGTTPKGFNATGEYEEASYHEFLSSIQNNKLTPLIDRHHDLVIRSILMPKYEISEFDTCIMWHPIDEMTEEEVADVNLKKAQTDVLLSQAGAVDSEDVRDRLIADESSGYNGITSGAPDDIDLDDESDDLDTELPSPKESHGGQV